MRRPHWLRPTRRASYPEELVVFDTETAALWEDDSICENVLMFGWACYSRWYQQKAWGKPQWFRFQRGIELWQWLEQTARNDKPLWVFCHNANFDWQTTEMTTLLHSLGWECCKVCIEDPPNYFEWRKGHKTLRLLDSTNYWRQSLAKIGERIGLAKLEPKHAYHFPILDDEYCIRDCDVILTALQEWIAWLREHELGGLAISLAGQAWSAYRYSLMDSEIFVHNDRYALAMEREAYCGGRTEAWTVGVPVHNLVGVDVNSMYPYVMREHEYPVQLIGVYSRPTESEFKRWLHKYCMIARVELDTDEPVYPERADGKLIFPTGRFAATLSTPELTYAYDHGHLVRVHDVALYEKGKLFTRFVDKLNSLKLDAERNGDELGRWLAKIMSNSLYGKFGQRGMHAEIIGKDDSGAFYSELEIDLDTGQFHRVRHLAGVITAMTRESESTHSCPAIAAHITAHARMQLWQYVRVVGMENVHYMDTDSLHINADALDALRDHLDSNRLGALKLEKRINIATYYGPKDYNIDNARTTKGVPLEAVELEPARFATRQWVSLRGALQRGHIGGPLIRSVTKELRREYTKGRVTASGRVLPFARDGPE